MPSYLNLFRQLRQDLLALYDSNEAGAIARWFLEELSGKSYSSLLSHDVALTDTQMTIWREKSAELLQGKPIQHITGYAWFLNRKFRVNEHTLIPRPETEELVSWIVNDWKDREPIHILDVGTGSGCIAISLSLALPHARVMAIDISAEALKIAQANNDTLGASVTFQQLDFLHKKHELPFFDVLVSNPPYIPFSEKEKLAPNVRDYEPGTALFVPNDDPAFFYHHLALFGERSPFPPVIYCELHQDYAFETLQAFWHEYHYHLRQDMYGNDRILKLIKKK